MSDNTEEKKRKGRPRERPTDLEDRRKKANQLLSDLIEGKTNLTEGAIRRQINLLGDNPNIVGQRDFMYSNIGGSRLVNVTATYSSPSSLSSSSMERPPSIEFSQEDFEEDDDEDDEEEETVFTAIEAQEYARSSLIDDMRRTRRPEISELHDSSVEIPTGIEHLNQNIQGINEREARNDDYDEWYDRTARMIETINSKRFQEDDVDLEQMEDEYDTRILNEPTGRELENANRELSERESFISSIVKNARDSFSTLQSSTYSGLSPESYNPMRTLAIEQIERKFGELEMRIPPELRMMGVQALEGIMRNADMKLNMDDVKNALSDYGIENFETSTLPFSGLIEMASNRLNIRNPFSRGFAAVKSITEKVPETLRKKVTEAGGNMIDALRFPNRTEAVGSSRLPVSPLPSRTDLSSVSEVGSTVSEVMTNIFGRSPTGNPPGGEPEVPKVPKDPRDYLIDQINSINLRLEDVSKVNKLKYPESKKIIKYRFPKQDENYSAVKLVQNATTTYLNDLNLYGTSFDDDI